MRCSHDCCTHFSPNPLPSPPDGNPQTPLAAAPAPAGMVGGKCCCVFATTNVTQTLHLLEVEFQRWALRFHKCPNLRRMKSSACPSVPARTPSSLLAGHPALRDHEPCHCVGWETGPVVRKQRRCKDELTMEICSYRRENTATTQTWLLTDIYHFIQNWSVLSRAELSLIHWTFRSVSRGEHDFVSCVLKSDTIFLLSLLIKQTSVFLSFLGGKHSTKIFLLLSIQPFFRMLLSSIILLSFWLPPEVWHWS